MVWIEDKQKIDGVKKDIEEGTFLPPRLRKWFRPAR